MRIVSSWLCEAHARRSLILKLFSYAKSTVLFVVLALALSAMVTESFARGRFAALAVDARTGAILFSKDADGQRHPASLTKMMTLYLMFEDLKQGRITMDTKLTVSARAARMAPSKLGLKPGTTITVETAIKALVIKSANDVAAVVGENLSGTESAFAARMTRKAREIGMSRTHYANASGLPNPSQVTTARDQATLGLRLMRDYPQYYPYFRAKSFTFRGRTIRTHNGLVLRYRGTDGIKTGYINASGYNLVTSTKRNDKRLVGVVIGGRTASQRNSYMVSMLNSVFSKAKSGNTIAAAAGTSAGAINPIANMVKPVRKSAPTVAPIVAAAVPTTDDKFELARAAESAAMEQKAAQAALGTDEGEDDEVAGGSGPQVLEAQLTEEGDVENGELVTGSTTPGWDIQIGDFASQKLVKKSMIQLKARKELAGKDMLTESIQDGNRVVYRARVIGFTEEAAQAACVAIVQKGLTCQRVAPET
jgi:D-alanyl-D-alanine carboxypeptidase